MDGQQHTSSFFAPLAEARSRRDRTSEHRWTLLISRLGALCLQYVSDGATTAVAGAVPSLRSSRDGSKSIGAEDASAMDVVDTDGNEGENTVQTTVGYTEAVRVLSIITSFEQWGKQGGNGGEATVLCRRLLVSLALGKLVLQADESPGATTSGTKVAVGSGPDRDSQPTKGPVPSAFGNSPSASGVPSGRTRGSVRLLMRASSADVSSGRWMRTPLLFRVLRVHWDAAAMETAAAAGESGESVKAVVRLLCDASLKALGICTADAVSSPAAGAREKGEGELPATLCASEQTSRHSVADIEGVGMAVAAESALARIPYGDQTAVFLRRETLQAFACTVLPSPKLLEHPFRALLVDPMLAGDAQAWWELVAVSGEVVGATDVEMGPCGSGAAGGRGDVAWTVANLLRVSNKRVRGEMWAATKVCCASRLVTRRCIMLSRSFGGGNTGYFASSVFRAGRRVPCKRQTSCKADSCSHPSVGCVLPWDLHGGAVVIICWGRVRLRVCGWVYCAGVCLSLPTVPVTLLME